MIKRFMPVLVILSVAPFCFAETIYLKSGKIVEGKLIEKTDDYIKIDFQGVSLTYFLDEIEAIDGLKLDYSNNKKQNYYVNEEYGISVTGPKGWYKISGEELIKIKKEANEAFLKDWNEKHKDDHKAIEFGKAFIDSQDNFGKSLCDFFKEPKTPNKFIPHISLGILYKIGSLKDINSEYELINHLNSKQFFPSQKLISPVEEVIINNKKVVTYTVEVQTQLQSVSIEVKQRHYLFLKNNFIIDLSCEAKKEEFNDNLPIFEKVINSGSIK